MVIPNWLYNQTPKLKYHSMLALRSRLSNILAAADPILKEYFHMYRCIIFR
jgi:hypothetical protein